MNETDRKVHSLTIPRNAQTTDPYLVLAMTTKQIQGEVALTEAKEDDGLGPDDANYYYKVADGFFELHIWANDRTIIEDVSDILVGRYGHDEYEIDTHLYGEA